MRVCLQLHPDWPTVDDSLVLAAIARDGVYRSQFETGTSNGGLTAWPGGDRHRWESRLFAGRYDDGPAAERPVYGAVDRGSPWGPAPRFGSAYLRLSAAASARATFCFPDSVFEPVAVGGPDDLPDLLRRAEAAIAQPGADPLDDYVEAHVHGRLVVARDVEAVVLDPCFRGGPVEVAARGLGCAIEWHPGFRVATAGLDPAYRGARFVELARRLGPGLTPATIGDTARRPGVDLVALKRVWHLLARFGRNPIPR